MACPEGWEQKETAEGDPFCFNPETGDVKDDDFDKKERQAEELRRMNEACREARRDAIGAVLVDASFIAGAGAQGAARAYGLLTWGAGAAIQNGDSPSKWVPGVNVSRAYAREWRVCSGRD